MDIRKSEPIKDGSNVIGNRTKIKIVKNKVAPPFRSCTVDMIFGEGISQASSLLELAVEREIIKKAGAWYSYNGNRIGQGRENTVKYLKENPEFYAEIDKRIRDEFAGGMIEVPMDTSIENEEDDEDDTEE